MVLLAWIRNKDFILDTRNVDERCIISVEINALLKCSLTTL